MTGHADFTDEEWEQVLMGPPSAGMIVMTAERGGTFRETYSMAKSYAEARQQHGESELLDEITAAKPKVDHTRFHSPEEMKAKCLENIRDALSLLAAKASDEEVSQYKAFVKTLAEHVAEAHKEHGVRVTDAERAAIDEIEATLGASGT